MIDIIFIAVAVLYFIKILFFRSGCKRAENFSSSDELPFVSIIVAARNEEKNMVQCIDALSRVDYPPDRFEIIIINDQSTDRTGEIIQSKLDVMPALRYLETKDNVYSLHGKANAVAQAIDHAKGEIILTSDADCVVPQSWVKSMMKMYQREVGCACGFTLLTHKSMFTGMQSLDWAYLLIIASAGVGWGLPLSAVGNNMSFRKKAYTDVGGYHDVGFSVTEDFLLFKSIAYQTNWKVRYPVDQNALVWSEPCATWHELYLQKKRWGRGGLRIHPLGYFIMSIGFLMNVGLLITPFFLSTMWIWLGVIATKCIGDFILLYRPLAKLNQKKLLRFFVPFELYYIFYVTLLPFIVMLTGRVVWKGRKL